MKIIIGITVILMLVALYLIFRDIIRKPSKNVVFPCCEQIENAHKNSSFLDAKRI